MRFTEERRSRGNTRTEEGEIKDGSQEKDFAHLRWNFKGHS